MKRKVALNVVRVVSIGLLVRGAARVITGHLPSGLLHLGLGFTGIVIVALTDGEDEA